MSRNSKRATFSCWCAPIVVLSPLVFVTGCAETPVREHPRITGRFSSQAIQILDEPDRMILLSLNPNDTYPEHPARSEEGIFYDWPILGEMEVTDMVTRKVLVDAFFQGISESDGSVAACFVPRHGLIFERHGKRAEFVICFECRQVSAHGDHVQGGMLTSDSPAATFNQILTDAGIPLAQQPGAR